MERKIGEIFENNGEWYQCVKGNDCADCVFHDEACNSGYLYKIIGSCCYYRADKCTVIFKKLEKIGKPFLVRYDNNSIIKYQRYKIYIPYIIRDDNINFNNVGNFLQIDIEIKQNKEDMEEEEKKIQHYDCFFNEKSSKYELKPFDLEAAKAGKPVCTRDGRKARIICFDKKGDDPIIALVETKGNKDILIEDVETYFINGHAVFEVEESELDLMMLPEKKEGWINVYKHFIYKTKEEAKSNVNSGMELIDTIKIEWEE